LVDYTPYDAFPAETHEAALDKLVMMIQQGDVVGGSNKQVRFTISEPIANQYLPDVASRANKAFHFSSTGEIVMATPSAVIDPSIQVISDIDSIANLRTLDVTGLTFPATKILVSGYYADGDGGGGVFYWDSASVETDNNGTIIKATATTTGRWKRIYEGEISVKYFGASPTALATINDTAIQEAIDYAYDLIGLTVVSLVGDTYLTSTTIHIKLDTVLINGTVSYSGTTVDAEIISMVLVTGGDGTLRTIVRPGGAENVRAISNSTAKGVVGFRKDTFVRGYW